MTPFISMQIDRRPEDFRYVISLSVAGWYWQQVQDAEPTIVDIIKFINRVDEMVRGALIKSEGREIHG